MVNSCSSVESDDVRCFTKKRDGLKIAATARMEHESNSHAASQFISLGSKRYYESQV